MKALKELPAASGGKAPSVEEGISTEERRAFLESQPSKSLGQGKARGPVREETQQPSEGKVRVTDDVEYFEKRKQNRKVGEKDRGTGLKCAQRSGVVQKTKISMV